MNIISAGTAKHAGAFTQTDQNKRTWTTATATKRPPFILDPGSAGRARPV